MNRVDSIKTTFSTPVEVSWTVLILVTIIILNVGWGLGLILSLFIFSSILLHEYAHIYSGYRNEISTRSITVFAFGAAANMYDMDHITTGKVALAGPLMSFCLAIIALLLNTLFESQYIIWFGSVNFIIGAFNILPLFPLDGGRILHSIITGYSNKRTATLVTAIISIVACFILAVVCLFFGLFFSAAVLVFVSLLSISSIININNN